MSTIFTESKEVANVLICCFPYGYTDGVAKWGNVINFGYLADDGLVSYITKSGRQRKTPADINHGDFIRALSFCDINMKASLESFMFKEDIPVETQIIYNPHLKIGKEVSIPNSRYPLLLHMSDEGILYFTMSEQIA